MQRDRPPRALLLALAMVCAVSGRADAQVQLPPPGNRSVHDLAGVLRAPHAQAMEQIHAELYRKTGVAIVVITVAGLDGESINGLADRVGEEWGVGRKGEDRGIVVALAVEEKRIAISTGYGVEGFLPDGRIGGIIDRAAMPDLKRGDHSTALLQTSAVLVGAAASEYGVSIRGVAPRAVARTGAPRRGRPGPLGILMTLLMLAGMGYLAVRHPTLFFLLLLSGMGRRGGYRGGFGGGGFGGGSGFGGFGGGGFGGGGASRGF